MDLHSLVVGRDAMACRFEVVFNAGEVENATELAVDALDLVEQIESRITVYRDSSEVARLNATAGAGWQPVSPRDKAPPRPAAIQRGSRTGGGRGSASGFPRADRSRHRPWRTQWWS
jgi:thiamine biosynthesis lipoprotein